MASKVTPLDQAASDIWEAYTKADQKWRLPSASRSELRVSVRAAAFNLPALLSNGWGRFRVDQGCTRQPPCSSTLLGAIGP